MASIKLPNIDQLDLTKTTTADQVKDYYNQLQRRITAGVLPTSPFQPPTHIWPGGGTTISTSPISAQGTVITQPAYDVEYWKDLAMKTAQRLNEAQQAMNQAQSKARLFENQVQHYQELREWLLINHPEMINDFVTWKKAIQTLDLEGSEDQQAI